MVRIEISDKELQRIILKEKGFDGSFDVITSVKIRKRRPKLTFWFDIKEIKRKEE